MEQNINLVQLTGRVLHKYTSEDHMRLSFVLGIYIPKNHVLNEDHRMNRDFPMIVVEGEKAEDIMYEFDEGDMVSVVGRVETRPVMHHQGKRTYKKTYDTVIFGDEVVVNAGAQNMNSVCLLGECTRVYRNADRGKKFYIITVKTVLEDGQEVVADVTYFDRQMELEPEVGDLVYLTGSVRTKNRVESGRRRILTSIVARNAAIR